MRKIALIYNSRSLNIILIATFILAICTPATVLIFSPAEKVSLQEKRTLTPQPAIPDSRQSFTDYPKNFESYFNDHIGFRAKIISWHHYIKSRWLHISPVKKIVLGKNNWLFLNINDMIADYRGLGLYSAKDLHTIKGILSARQNMLAQLGIKYLLVVAPNKQSIYPERMPDYISRIVPKTRLDQLAKLFRDQSNINFIDLKTALLQRKSSDNLLYLTQDSHWNHRGAFVAYHEIIKDIQRWHPKTRILDISDQIEISYRKSSRDDLAKMIGFPSENAPFFKINEKMAFLDKGHQEFIALFAQRYKESYKEPFITKKEASGIRVAVFRDSFFTDIAPFLSESIGQVIYIYEPYSQEIMAQLFSHKLKPDIVIEEIAERDLWKIN